MSFPGPFCDAHRDIGNAKWVTPSHRSGRGDDDADAGDYSAPTGANGVELSRPAQMANLFIRKAEQFGKPHGELPDVLGMLAGHVIAVLESERETFENFEPS